MRGVIYARVSTDKQEYSRQIHELEDYAKRNAIELVLPHLEEIESGFNSDRPEYNKLMSLTKEDIDIVLIWELSRLSRKSIEIQSDIEKLAEKGIDVYVHNKGLHTLDKDGKPNSTTKLIVSIIATLAEEEAKTFKERSKSAKIDKIIHAGNSYTSLAPYGYDYNPETKKLTINEEEARIIKYIFRLCKEGLSLYSIALRLNNEGVPTKKRNIKNIKKPKTIRHDGTWSTASLGKLVRNPVYYGKPTISLESETSKSKVFTRNKSRFVKNIHTLDRPDLAIITEEEFNDAAKARESRKSRCIASDVTKYLLQHIFVCPDCQRYYTLDKCKKHIKYKCSRRYDKTEPIDCTSAAQISGRKLDIIMWESVKAFCLEALATQKKTESKESLELEIAKREEMIMSIEKQKKEHIEKAKIISREALELKIKFPNLPELYEERIKDVKIHDVELGRLDSEQKKYLSEIATFEANIKALESIKDTDYLEDVDFEGKYDLIHKVVDKAYPYATGNNRYILIEVLLKTGKTFYIGYFPYKWYYISFPKTDINYYSHKENKGYRLIQLPDYKNGVMLSSDIIDFLKANDIEGNRHFVSYRYEQNI